MSASATLQADANTGAIHVSGLIDFDSVLTYRQRGEQMILSSSQSGLQINLSQAKIGGSVGVSLLLSWLRCASKADKTIAFQQVPENLCEMIRVNGVEEIIAFD